MPARSEAQRRYLYAHFGSAWVHKHHFANKGKLPKRVSRGKTRHPLTRSMVEKGKM